MMPNIEFSFIHLIYFFDWISHLNFVSWHNHALKQSYNGKNGEVIKLKERWILFNFFLCCFHHAWRQKYI